MKNRERFFSFVHEFLVYSIIYKLLFLRYLFLFIYVWLILYAYFNFLGSPIWIEKYMVFKTTFH